MLILGIVLLAIGLVLLFLAWDSSREFTEKVARKFKGHYSQNTMIYVIGGITLTVAGLALIIFGSDSYN